MNQHNKCTVSRLGFVGFVLSLIFCLSGCGQTGPLYLPKSETSTQQVATNAKSPNSFSSMNQKRTT